MQIPEAQPLPFRAINKGEFITTAIYTLPKTVGLYRRISRDGRAGLKPADGAVLAIAPAGKRDGEPVGGLVELKRWVEAEDILGQFIPTSAKPPF